MRILWVSDSTWHKTGYGITTEHLTRRMVKDGHRVFVYAPGAMHGGKYDDPEGRTIIGSNYGDDRWGNGTLVNHLLWIEPDVIITWLDPQGLVNYGWTEHPIYMWNPVDTWPLPKEEMAIMGRANQVMACSKWGVQVLEKQGVSAKYIPCGLNLQTYNIDPAGRNRWREQLRPELSDDTFLIGSVGLNTGSPDRKGYGYEFDAIKRFSEKHDNIRVYIHTNANGDGGAIDLISLREEMGLEGVVCFSRPSGGLGETELYMRDMYNAFDVLLHCGMCEGFGVPLIEAQACGTPVVANSCTAMTELMSDLCYPCEPNEPIWVSTSTHIAPPNVDNIVEGLERAYEDWRQKKHDRAAIRKFVLQYEEDKVYDEYWRPLLQTVPEKIKLRGEGERRLVLAAGNTYHEGHTHHDIQKFGEHIDVAHDLNEFPWPWEDNSWDYIEFSDCLEHLRVNYVQVMDELWRILAPGGHVFIHTAEAGSWQLYTDPTHIQGFSLVSMDYLDPETRHGTEYTYSEKKWKVLKRSIDQAGLVFILTPRKEPVKARKPRKKVTA